MFTVEGDTLASFAEELASRTDTPPDPAGLLKVMPPVMVLPTSMEELGRDSASVGSASPGEVTLNAALVEETRPGLLAVNVKLLPLVAMLRFLNVAMP
jgi:hypothetical protein